MKLKLLEPIKVGNKILKNRIVMPSMETRMSTIYGDVKPEIINYYEERARGGAGTIIVENTYIDNLSSRSSLSSSGMYSDHLVAGKNILAESVKQYGALALIQISHGGRQAAKDSSVFEPVAPSSVMCRSTERIPRELTLQEIIQIEDAFAQAAQRAKNAGFDGVEVHGAHGYLICSFLSPRTNLRTDKYGGVLENRARFAKNIIKKIRQITGNDFIIGYRISASEYIEGGLEIKQACDFAKLIETNIDYMSVSAGIYESPIFRISAPSYMPRGELIPLAEKIKRSVCIPVIAVGSFNAEIAENVIKNGSADMAALGRALIADPELPNKLKEGRQEDIRPCIRGNEGCVSGFKTGCYMRCEVNPACGREAYFNKTGNIKNRKILILGGGIAGMEAARISDLLGHEVTLVEKESELGGHLKESSRQEFKYDILEYFNWIRIQLKKSGVKLLLNTFADSELIKLLKPDALIIAIGSEYIIPDIEGSENAVIAKVILDDISIAGSSVIIIGGGLVGCETALALALKKRKTTIVEMTESIAQDHETVSREALLRILYENKVDIHKGCKVLRIGRDYISVKDKNEKSGTFKADTIVLATGLKASNTGKLLSIFPNAICIGDCVQARKIYNCTHEAWNAVFKISKGVFKY